MNTPIVISHIHLLEGAAQRAIRDTLDAFAVSLADTLAQTDEGWTAWATQNAAGDASIMYVAEDGGTWIGMAGGTRDTSQPEKAAHLISM